jgi:hypothetical protein
VLWHAKTVRAGPRVARSSSIDLLGAGSRTGVTEILRLDLSRWLAHTDDPKSRLVLVGEDDQVRVIHPPRVYNLNVVYRWAPEGAEGAQAEWRRLRVVVSRKGIARLERIRG